MVSILEYIREATVLLALVCTFLFYRHLKKIKYERKHSFFETTMYVVTYLTIFLWAGCSFLLFLDKM